MKKGYIIGGGVAVAVAIYLLTKKKKEVASVIATATSSNVPQGWYVDGDVLVPKLPMPTGWSLVGDVLTPSYTSNSIPKGYFIDGDGFLTIESSEYVPKKVAKGWIFGGDNGKVYPFTSTIKLNMNSVNERFANLNNQALLTTNDGSVILNKTTPILSDRDKEYWLKAGITKS